MIIQQRNYQSENIRKLNSYVCLNVYLCKIVTKMCERPLYIHNFFLKQTSFSIIKVQTHLLYIRLILLRERRNSFYNQHASDNSFLFPYNIRNLNNMLPESLERSFNLLFTTYFGARNFFFQNFFLKDQQIKKQ